MNNRVIPTDVPKHALADRHVSADSGRPFASLLVPGLGQFLQRRPLVGAAHLATVIACTIAASTALGGGRAYLLALLWNVWSVVDAWRWERAR